MLQPSRPSGLAAAALVYSLAVIAFFWRVIFLPDFGIPWDIVDAHFTAQSFFSRWLRKGVFALWNPHVTMGYPIAGDMVLSPFYPPTVLSWLVPTGGPFHFRTLEIVLILHVLLAGVSMYMLCRSLRLDYWPSLFAGTVFMFGGFFPVRISHEPWVKSAAWTPLVLLFFVRALDTGSRRAVAACAAAFGIMILAGYAQHVLYTAYLLIAWFLLTTLPRLPKTGFRPLLQRGTTLVVIVAVGALLAAVQLLPAAELASHAARTRLTFQDSALGAINLLALATVFLPDLYRPAPSQDMSANFGDPSLIHLYTGLFVLAFAFVGLRTRTAPHRYRPAFVVIGIVAFVLSLGAATPMYEAAFHYVPGFALFRRPLTFYHFVLLSLCVLGAIGLQAFLNRDERDRILVRQALTAVVAGLLLAVIAWAVFEWLRLAEPGIRTSTETGRDAVVAMAPWLAHAFGVMVPVLLAILACFYLARRAPAVAPAAICLLAFADLYWFNANRIFNTAPAAFWPISELARFRRADVLGPNGTGWHRVALSNFGGIFENAGDIMGFENFGGYNPLRLRLYTDFAGLVNGPRSPLLDLANVKYILTTPVFRDDGRAATEPSAASPMNYRVFLRSGALDPARHKLVASAAPYELYENSTVLPRYFGVSDVVVKLDMREQFEILRTGYNFHSTVLLDRRPRDPVAGCDSLTTHISALSPATARLRVSSPGHCILVASEIWYPGWRAYVDGREVPLMRANYAFRAIEVPGGSHTVEFRFRPWTVQLGAALSIATALALALATRFL